MSHLFTSRILQEYNTDTTVRFVVSLLPGKLAEVEAEGVHKVFKLQTTISMTCMNAFDHNNCLNKYAFFSFM